MEKKVPDSDKVTGKRRRDGSSEEHAPYNDKIACVDNTPKGLKDFSDLMRNYYRENGSHCYNTAMIMARLLAPSESDQAHWITDIDFTLKDRDVDNYVAGILRSFKDPNILVSGYAGDNEIPILCYLAQTPGTDYSILALIQAGANLDLDTPDLVDAPYLVTLGIQGRFSIVRNLIEAGARANFDIDYVNKLKENPHFKQFLRYIIAEDNVPIPFNQARENLNITKTIYDQYMKIPSGELKNIEASRVLATDITGMVGRFS